MIRHRIGANHRTAAVRHYIALASVLHDSDAVAGWGCRALSCGAALHFAVEHGRATRLNRHDYTSPSELWPWVYSRLTTTHTTWMIAYKVNDSITAAQIWMEMEAGRLRPRKALRKAPEDAPDDESGPQSAGLLCTHDPPVILDLEHQSGARLVVVDLRNWVQLPIDDIARSFGVAPPGELGDAATDDDAAARRDRELLAVREATVGLVSWVRDNKLGNQRYTCAGQSLAAWRHQRRDCDIYPCHAAGYKELERAAYHPGVMRAYFTGAVELPMSRWWGNDRHSGRGIPVLFTGPVYRLDVNACYVYCMDGLDFPVKLVGMDVNPEPADVLARLDTDEAVALVTIDSRQQPYPVRMDNKPRHATGVYQTALCGPDLRLALERRDIRHVHEVHWHQRGRPFTSFCKLIYGLREKYGNGVNPALRAASKDLGTSLHGKFAQRGGGWQLVEERHPEELWGTWFRYDEATGATNLYRSWGRAVEIDTGPQEKDDSYPLIAAYTAAYARHLMWDYRRIAGAENVYYQDVDSLHVSAGGMERLKSANCIHPTEPGKLKVEAVADSARWVGPKHYQLGDKWVRSGVSEGAWIDEDGRLRQKATKHMTAQLNGYPPPGPLVEDMAVTLPTPQLGGRMKSDGWLEWPILPD